jgi:hypothetical protein
VGQLDVRGQRWIVGWTAHIANVRRLIYWHKQIARARARRVDMLSTPPHRLILDSDSAN